ncbi:unnamed protein product [Paramecium octaurelia]|uniref:Tetratricopeptide repeat protein n=1 Tax=Paramecium octaurelia TaxID=43137 RepID=A0A8S1XRC6_PAROT|nr:unnamed protein product [Paramecium octaurelia]
MLCNASSYNFIFSYKSPKLIFTTLLSQSVAQQRRLYEMCQDKPKYCYGLQKKILGTITYDLWQKSCNITIKLQKKIVIVITHICVKQGLYYMDEQLNDCALQDFNQVIEINPHYSLFTIIEVTTILLNILGNLYTEVDEKDKALIDYNKAIQLDPQSFSFTITLQRRSLFAIIQSSTKQITNSCHALNSSPKRNFAADKVKSQK